MRGAIDRCADGLRAYGGGFTRRNLYFAFQRDAGRPISGGSFEAALRRRLARGPIPGLLPSPTARRVDALSRGWEERLPTTVLLVDRRAILDLLLHAPSLADAGVAVVSVDGAPSPLVTRLRDAFMAGHRASALYLHDAATVLYPFTLEPIATLVERAPIVYADLGLPPLGAPGRRFEDPALAGHEIVDLEAVPPLALIRYVLDAARRGAGDPTRA